MTWTCPPSAWRRSACLFLALLAWTGCTTTPVPSEEAPVAPETSSAVAGETAEVTAAVVEAKDAAETAEPAAPAPALRPGEPLARSGDEIVVAGQLFHTGTPVVLWTDPGGYDGYRVERRFAPWAESDWDRSKAANSALSTPNRFGLRAAVLTPPEIERVRGGGWDLPLLQKVIDQFVLHYDASGTSRLCFQRLHDDRGLSIHFMLDVDGTIYQTLDLKERAWHATVANSRSIGIEIANIGAYVDPAAKPLTHWYETGEDGQVRLTIPPEAFPASLRNQAAVLRPDRNALISGPIHGETFHQYDLTPAQYAALAKLTAALCRIFPHLVCDYPRNADGEVLTETLSEADWKAFRGVIGHYHVQRNKVDPGPALQWERLISEARSLMAPDDPSPAAPGETPALP